MGGAFERLFCPEGREFEQANLQKFKCPGSCPGGGMLKLQFDWYIIIIVQSLYSAYYNVSKRFTILRAR